MNSLQLHILITVYLVFHSSCGRGLLPTMQFPRVSQNSKAPYPVGCSHGNTASGFHKKMEESDSCSNSVNVSLPAVSSLLNQHLVFVTNMLWVWRKATHLKHFSCWGGFKSVYIHTVFGLFLNHTHIMHMCRRLVCNEALSSSRWANMIANLIFIFSCLCI